MGVFNMIAHNSMYFFNIFLYQTMNFIHVWNRNNCPSTDVVNRSAKSSVLMNGFKSLMKLCQLQTLTLNLSFNIGYHLLMVSVIRRHLIQVCLAHFSDYLIDIRLQLHKLIR